PVRHRQMFRNAYPRGIKQDVRSVRHEYPSPLATARCPEITTCSPAPWEHCFQSAESFGVKNMDFPVGSNHTIAPTTAMASFPNAMPQPRRVLVTGGAGFIGSHLCERLLEIGCDLL